MNTDIRDPSVIAAFWSRVDVHGPNECWVWKGNIRQPQGYGNFRQTRAHRLAYEIFHGHMPDDPVIRHLCHNKLCCNPRHLEPGTPADNAADELARGNTMRGNRHGKCKLSDDDVRYIRASTMRVRDLAKKFNCAVGTISGIRGFHTRKHVEQEPVE